MKTKFAIGCLVQWYESEIIEEYLENVDEVFKLISLAIKKNNVKKLLKTSVRSDSFKRLTK